MFRKTRIKFLKWLREVEREENANIPDRRTGNAELKKAQPDDTLSSHAIHFKVFRGSGGIVIETVHSDRNMQTSGEIVLHVIPEGEDLATSLAHIITLQSIRG